MIKTYCDFCGKEIETPNDEVNIDFHAYGCTNFPAKEYQFHVACARKVKDNLEYFIEKEGADNGS